MTPTFPLNPYDVKESGEYYFRADSGETVVKTMTRQEVIDLPTDKGKSYVEEDGKRFFRVVASLGEYGFAYMDYDHSAYPKISKTLPQWCEGADHVQDAGRHQGCAIIRSRKHQDELCKRHGFTREYHHSDLKYVDRPQRAELNHLFGSHRNG